MLDVKQIGEPLEIDKLGIAIPVEGRYDYAADGSKCGVCGSLGIPWGGWFSCEDCPCVALVADGRCFWVPIYFPEKPTDVNGYMHERYRLVPSNDQTNRTDQVSK